MRSEKLRHFTETDPVPLNYLPEKVKAREELEAQVAAFKARGGQIQVVDATANRVPVYIVNDVVRAG